jgi:hypothetical protein
MKTAFLLLLTLGFNINLFAQYDFIGKNLNEIIQPNDSVLYQSKDTLVIYEFPNSCINYISIGGIVDHVLHVFPMKKKKEFKRKFKKSIEKRKYYIFDYKEKTYIGTIKDLVDDKYFVFDVHLTKE